MLSTVNNGYETVEFLQKDGRIRREVINKPNPGKEAYASQRAENNSSLCYGFRYSFNQYTSIGGPRNLTKVNSGTWFVDGVVYSRSRVKKVVNNSDLRDRLLNLMDANGTDFVVFAKETWSAFDHIHDRCITA